MLNNEQFKASRADNGSSLILAGAGSGKTKTLVEKVKNVINEMNIKCENIILLTFSKKAAEEIRNRVKSEIGAKADKIFAGTFHSFCYKIIKDNIDYFITQSPYTEFPKIFTDEIKLAFIDKYLSNKLKNFMGFPKDVISTYINNPEKIDEIHFDELRKNINIAINDINQYKINENLIDFEELLYYTNKMLSNNIFRNTISSKIDYIFVDEFQDTSDNNFELISNLVNSNNNIFMVGDDFQSIYKFRKANIDYIIDIKKYFSDIKTYRLSINYRSKKEIVTLANHFIKKNKNQTKKELHSYKGKGGKVYLISYFSKINQIDCLKIIFNINKNKSFTIIYRNNYFYHYLIKKAPELLSNKNFNFMTIHASKGLEFNNLIIADIDDKIIPSNGSDIEEERRLFYVAITRAKENIIFLYNNSGKIKPKFINELNVKNKWFVSPQECKII